MRIILVRHGESDYTRDCLTEKGRSQAAAIAERLANEGISRIYTSPAKRLDLPLTVLFCLREVAWGVPSSSHDNPPWDLGKLMLEDGFDFRSRDWQEHPYFDGNFTTGCCGTLTEELDDFLAKQGYRHEGRRFFHNGSADQRRRQLYRSFPPQKKMTARLFLRHKTGNKAVCDGRTYPYHLNHITVSCLLYITRSENVSLLFSFNDETIEFLRRYRF